MSEIPQAPVPSLDARDLHQKALRAALDCLNAHEHWQDRVERARCVIEEALAAPTAPSDALRAAFASALKTLSKWKAAWSERDRHTAIRMRVEASEETRDLMELDPAALAASPSVTREQELNAAWIKGCLAGREEAAAWVDSESQARVAGSQNQLYSASIASGIRNLPAPTAPKEPQR